MSDHIALTIADFEVQLQEKLDEVRKLKALINQLAERAQFPIPHPEVEERSATSHIRQDLFYGKALHTAMRMFLEMRGQDRGAVTVNEIFDALRQGGYQFDTKNDENAKRIIRITLSKNSIVFHKLPNGSYGLLSWYPGAKQPRQKPGRQAPEEAEDDEETVLVLPDDEAGTEEPQT